MIREFAVDPEMIGRWERFRYVIDQFGVHNGRLISEYPSFKKWRKLVYQAIDASRPLDVERQRLIQRLSTIQNADIFSSRPSTWNGELDWLANAEQECETRPFDAILSNNNPRKHELVLSYELIDPSEPLWASPLDLPTPRTEADIALLVAPLTRVSRKIAFVDPYFSPGKEKMLSALKAILVETMASRKDGVVPEIEFHVPFLEKEDLRNKVRRFFGNVEHKLPRFVPKGLSIRVVLWGEKPSGDGFHNRYVLTERGGIRLGWGLEAGGANKTDDIGLMSPATHSHRWNHFYGANPAFDRIDERVFVGLHHI